MRLGQAQGWGLRPGGYRLDVPIRLYTPRTPFPMRAFTPLALWHFLKHSRSPTPLNVSRTL